MGFDLACGLICCVRTLNIPFGLSALSTTYPTIFLPAVEWAQHSSTNAHQQS